jgi:hypothetical protein
MNYDIMFIDYMKAFNKVLRNKLWDKMRKKRHPEHLIRTEEMYKDTTICTDTELSVSSRSEMTNQGIQQECPMHPTLFNILYMPVCVRHKHSHLCLADSAKIRFPIMVNIFKSNLIC